MKKNIIYIICTCIIMSFIFYCSLKYIYSKDIVLNDDYIAVFKGDNNSTYVYTRLVKKKGKTVDVVFKYINTETVINSYDDSYTKENVLKKAKAKNIDDLFDKAYANSAYSYVILVDENISMDISEFKTYLKEKKVDSYEK